MSNHSHNPYTTPRSFDADVQPEEKGTEPSLWSRCLGILAALMSLVLIAGLLVSDLIQVNLSIAGWAMLWFWLPGIFMLLVTLTMVIINAGKHSKFDWIWFTAFLLQFVGLLLTLNSPTVSAVMTK